ncbi:hypothetical protein EVAR_60573_1 [Eumeta japonica]|uniref:Uncharacterized protein n=1 Tax=Eumeta variegata TaxID=151549 RepID=A0A4C1YGI1_EUMVA|nr:hypothetical protein EVAR_60573_1 [Eumeta japonica]
MRGQGFKRESVRVNRVDGYGAGAWTAGRGSRRARRAGLFQNTDVTAHHFGPGRRVLSRGRRHVENVERDDVLKSPISSTRIVLSKKTTSALWCGGRVSYRQRRTRLYLVILY